MEESMLHLEIPVLLPEIKQESDGCMERLCTQVSDAHGIQKAHIERENGTTVLCLHYNPDLITLPQVRALAEQTGARLMRQFHHETLRVTNMDCDSCALSIEHILGRKPGVLDVSVSAAAERMRIEYDSTKISHKEIVRLITSIGYSVEEKRQESRLERALPLLTAGAAGLFLAIGFFGSTFFHFPPALSLSLYILAYLFGGYEPAYHGLAAALRLQFDIDSLMVLAAIGAAVLGQWAEGAFLLFLFSLGHALEHLAMDRARHAIEALSDVAPQTGRVRRGGQEFEIEVEELQRGDTVIVRPGERIPADGFVSSGFSAVNQAPITGESLPVDKTQGDEVFAGSINGDGSLEIEVSRLAQDSTMARMIRLVEEAQTQKSPTQRFAEWFERIFVPVTLALVVLVILLPPLVGWLPWQESLVRGLTLLVAASPCALAIATPSAVLAGIAQAARSGVLIKGGAHLENLGKLNALAFDKTGTLTRGEPAVTDILPLDSLDENALLQLAAAVESRSSHPLARAVVRRAKNLPEIDYTIENVQTLNGQGIQAQVNGQDVRIGSPKLFQNDPALTPNVLSAVNKFERAGKTTVLVQSSGKFLGVLALADQARTTAPVTIRRLQQMNVRPVMLTGDNSQVAQAVSSEIGLQTFRASLLPEQKVEAIRSLQDEFGSVAMVGDGVNDAPALAAATVGIAMGGAGTAVALETADVALMADDLHQLPFAVSLGRQANLIVRQNLVIALGVVAVLVPLAITGLASIGPAVIFHEGSTVLVVLNALRLLNFRFKE